MKTIDGVFSYENEDIAALFPKRKPDSHKGDFGVAAIVAGYGSLGAPVLSVGAALKAGAGYTKLYLPPELYPAPRERLLAAMQMPACMLVELNGIGELLPADAIAYGMGAGVSEWVYETVRTILADYRGKLVLDADALNAISAYGKDVLKTKMCEVIVTPHPKEFSRLTGKSVEEILKDPIGAAKAFAEEYGVTVLLKNHRSVITNGERIVINTIGSPALAKGGSGDVLSGFLAGTLARGLAPFAAAVASAYILGRAGELAAFEMGEYSPDATDIIRYLPRAILSLTE